MVSLSDVGLPSKSPSLVMYTEAFVTGWNWPAFSGQNRFLCTHCSSQSRMRSQVCLPSPSVGATGSSKNRRRASVLMMGTLRCLAMYPTIIKLPMCTPRVRKLCATAGTSKTGIALLNMVCMICSVASSWLSACASTMIDCPPPNE